MKNFPRNAPVLSYMLASVLKRHAVGRGTRGRHKDDKENVNEWSVKQACRTLRHT